MAHPFHRHHRTNPVHIRIDPFSLQYCLPGFSLPSEAVVSDAEAHSYYGASHSSNTPNSQTTDPSVTTNTKTGERPSPGHCITGSNGNLSNQMGTVKPQSSCEIPVSLKR